MLFELWDTYGFPPDLTGALRRRTLPQTSSCCPRSPALAIPGTMLGAWLLAAEVLRRGSCAHSGATHASLMERS